MSLLGSSTYPFFVVGIGFSAGGLQEIQNMLPLISMETNACYILISHLNIDYKSNLDAILSGYTNLPILWASHNLMLEPNTIYILPVGKMMFIKERRLMLRERGQKEIINNAIDIFLSSLAEDAQSKAIAVILSGGGQDGLFGTQQITKNRGLVIVQDPKTAYFPFMPTSIIQYDHPHYILSPKEIIQKISEQISKLED